MSMKFQWIVALGVLLLLVGCHRDTRPGWQKAQSEPHLQIPAGLDAPGRAAELDVPGSSSTVIGSVENDATPPTSISMDDVDGVDPTWRKVVEKLLDANVGTVVKRDDAANQLFLSMKGSELPVPERGFFSRMFHRGPDLNRDYFAQVSVVSENGVTKVRVDGDGPVVMQVHQALQGVAGLSTPEGPMSAVAPLKRVPLEQRPERDASRR